MIAAKSEFAAAMPGRKIQIWLEEIRAPFFTAVLVPVLLASVMAWQHGYPIQIGYFFITLLASVLIHAGTNVVNDYGDHLSGCDARNEEFVRPFTGGSRLIQNGTLSPKEVLTGSIILFIISTALGLLLVALKGMPIFYLGLAGTFCGIFYTLPPFNLAARGIGEFLVGLCFGTLMMLGAYYVQAQTFSTEVIVASIPVTLLIAGVLYINEFPDYVADRDSGKRHMVVRMGRKRAASGYVAIIALTYLSIIAGVAFGVLTPYTLLALLTVPKAIKAVKITRKHHSETPELVPANAATIAIHLTTGLLMTVGYILAAIF
ncbi:1,4-dihydroxy-2-naphthoate octaprenyltransferase [candidate division LCP-89 bacterium B3_LCP]|uniref:1,4-dihydroxy-2-naphthoate octaprenyltransferase n=1 Tax=candidate division LCP-89 bacterium B3_LCP TaxID=2012998 RepID=A0A532UVT8_UNCL8|nr:MAG: 1,4-dihydroxy-2-naphthoate octaprenyltransferase [candidate division LCP-89 bacterium B3_LCP]